MKKNRRIHIYATALTAISLALMPCQAAATCPSDEAVEAYAADYMAIRPNSSYTQQLTLAEAKCARTMLIARLSTSMGQVVGYKAAFASDELRGVFGFSEPVWGAMFEHGLKRSPAVVPASYGAGRWWESALIFKLKDGNMAKAKTPMDALKSVDAVIPFVELTDYMSPNPPKLVHYVANNANFRAGVLGAEIRVRPSRQMVDSLANLRIVTTDRVNKTTYHRISGKKAMDGNPLNAAIWLAKTLQQDGIVLKKGDLLSISGLTLGVWAQSGQSVSANYLGLPGNPAVSVEFN